MVVATVAAAAAVVLAGCTDETPAAGTLDEQSNRKTVTATSEPTEEPSTEPSESETTEANQTPEDVEDGEGQLPPDQLDSDLTAEAEAFVEEFMAAYDEAAVSGDLAKVKEMYTEACGVCASHISDLTRIYDAGGRLEGGGYIDPALKVVGGSGDMVVIEVTSEIGDITVFDADGNAVNEIPSYTATEEFRVQRGADDQWQVIGWTD